MNATRFIKIFFNNIFRFRFEYIQLFTKNIKLKIKSVKIKKDIFIITSCINTYDCTAYPIHNFSHLPKDRYEEVLAGIYSVYKFYPDAYIILIESSKLLIENRNHIQGLVDEYYDYSDTAIVNVARKHFNKGVPQFTALIKFIEENGASYQADTFHFLGGRYQLTGQSAQRFYKSGAYFLHYPQHDNVSTRYFFIKDIALSDIALPLRKTLYCAILGNSVEDFIHRFMKKVIFIDKLNVYGTVNGIAVINE